MTKNTYTIIFASFLTLLALASSLSTVSASASTDKVCRSYDQFCLDRQIAKSDYMVSSNRGGQVNLMVPAKTCRPNDNFCQTRLDLQNAGINRDGTTFDKAYLRMQKYCQSKINIRPTSCLPYYNNSFNR